MRVGVPAITTRGMKENDMKDVVDLVDKILMNLDDEKMIALVKNEVEELMNKFPLYPELG